MEHWLRRGKSASSGALTLCRAGNKKVFPTDTQDDVPPGNLFLSGRADHQWRERRIAAAKLKQAPKRLGIESSCLDFHCPFTQFNPRTPHICRAYGSGVRIVVSDRNSFKS